VDQQQPGFDLGLAVLSVYFNTDRGSLWHS
jgi:hypothetical protein